MIEYTPYSLDPSIPNDEANQFIIAEYEQLIEDYADPKQRSEYKTLFETLVNTISEDFAPEEIARLQGEVAANLFWHNRHHLRQTAHDNINVARISLKKNLLPPFLAFQLPGDGYGHDWGYIGKLDEINFPTYAHLIIIHVQKSLGRLVAYHKKNGQPSFLTEEQKAMGLWTATMATHATHFTDKETMAIYDQRRKTMICQFAKRFSALYDPQYLIQAGRLICDGAQFADLAQTADSSYFERLPGLAIEMNAVEPGRGDKQIGTTPEEIEDKSAWFIENMIVKKRVGKTARRLFGPHNAYEQAWQKLLKPSQSAA